MDISKALTYVFDDEKWLSKIGIGALLVLASVFIIPSLLIMGWLVATTRNVMADQEHPLAEWDDWGQLFKDGGSLFLATLVYVSPFILIVCIGAFAIIGLSGLQEFNEDAIAAVGVAAFALIGCLTLIMMLALFFLMPAVTIQYIRTNELAACFRIGEVIGIVRDNLGDIAIAALIPFGISFVATAVSGFIPCVGIIIAIAAVPYQYAVMGHLFGQLANKLDSKGDKFDAAMP